MGMYDELRCEAPLPDDGSAKGASTRCQTKSFPNPSLSLHVITPVGRLIDAAGIDLEPDGYITFYTSEQATTTGTASLQRVWYDYRARFVNGNLESIVRVSDDPSDRIYYGLASIRFVQSPGSLDARGSLTPLQS